MKHDVGCQSVDIESEELSPSELREETLEKNRLIDLICDKYLNQYNIKTNARQNNKRLSCDYRAIMPLNIRT